MKKLFLFLILFLSVVLPSCNEDNTENDTAYTQRLAGRWSLTGGDASGTTTNYTYTYTFQGDSFIYSEAYTSKTGTMERSWTVSGGWNVMKGTLQLNYDLSSLRNQGMSDAEMRSIRVKLEDWNVNLETINKKGRPFGYKIKFVDLNGKTGLTLNGINGTFVKISY
ncbi:MAG: hypothetical protein J6L73_01285 [Muribaculaceae bacterium]|nr:hypothetical protein [Muribaculaceae bacterium]